MKKRLLSVIIAISMIVGMAKILPNSSFNDLSITAYADTADDEAFEKMTPEGIKYVSSKSRVVILGYGGSQELTELTIPSTIDGVPVYAINDAAFQYKESLTSVVIEPGLKKIGQQAFDQCTNLRSVIVPDSVEEIESLAFQDTPFESDPSNEFLILGDQILYSYNGTSNKITIPDGVKKIHNGCFLNNQIVEEVRMPNSVEVVGTAAFSNKRNIKILNLSNNIRIIEGRAFEWCDFEEVNLPASVEQVTNSSFFYCYSLENIYIDENNPYYKSVDGVLFTKDGKELIAYPKNSSREIYYIPDGVENYHAFAFHYPTNLKTLVFPDSATRVNFQTNALNNGSKLSIPESVTEIYGTHGNVINSLYKTIFTDNLSLIVKHGSYAEDFAVNYGVPFECDDSSCELTPSEECIDPPTLELQVPKYSENESFYGRTTTSSGSYVYLLPNTIQDIQIENTEEQIYKAIGKFAFSDYRELKNIELPDTIECIGAGAFSGCKSLSSIILPENIKYIDGSAFSSTVLSEINLPDSVEYIGGSAFSNSKLSKISIPNKITSIKDSTFSRCSKLSGIYIPASVVNIAENAFHDCYFLTINAPKGSYAIEYAKKHDINYIEIENSDVGFSAEVDTDIMDQIYDNSNFTIASEDTSVVFDNNAMLEIQYNHGNKNVLFNYNIVNKNDVNNEQSEAVQNAISLMNFELKDSDGRSIPFNSEEKDGFATITIPYKAPIQGNKIKVFYIAPDGTKTDMNGTYNPSKKTITFTTTHFSLFTVEIDDGNNTTVKKPEFKVQNLVLSGQIGVNFYLDLSSLTTEQMKTSYMEFTVNGKTSKDYFDSTFKNQTGQYYGFTCYVNSVQMAENITAVFHYGNETVTKISSVLGYINLFEQNESKFDEKMVNLVHSLADYGHYIQPFVADNNNWVVGDRYAEMTKKYTDSYDYDSILSDLSPKAVVRDYGNSDISKLTFALYPDAETSINVYITPKTGYTGQIIINNGEYTAKKLDDGRYLVIIPNIAAHKLGNMYNLEIATESGNATMSVSVMSYVYAMLSSAYYANNITAKNAVSSLYQYYKSANAYLNNND